MIHGRSNWWACAVIVFTSWSTSAAELAEHIPGEYVVKVKPTLSSLQLGTLAAQLGGELVQSLSPESNAILLKREIEISTEDSIALLNQHPMVEYAEPNYVYRIDQSREGLPNDPELGRLWGLINSGQRIGSSTGVEGIDINAVKAWEIQTGSHDVIISVIDTGVLYNHPDLANNIWVNEAELNGVEGVDDDENGFVDDIHGWDFANNDNDPIDDQSHGTHCAGTIAAEGNNELGVVGVAWKARIMPIKFLSASGGGTLANAVLSIDYSTRMGAHISNNSWGGGGYSRALEESIERARDAGTLFVAAAGNSRADNDRRPAYPASYDIENIVSVAAMDNRGQLARFSNFGAKSVHIAAPGVDVLSYTTRGLQMYSGTSMAAPHVAGVAALMKSANSQMSPVEMKAKMIETARSLPGLDGRVVSGLVDAHAALID